MENKLAVFLVLVILVECNGQLSILGNILSTAREKVHSGIEGVAGAVLGRLNIGGHFGFNKQNGQPPPQRGRDETIVVVVKENNQNGYQPPNIPTNQRPLGYPEPDYNNQINGPYNNYGHQNTQNPGYQGNGNNFQQGQQEYSAPDYNNQNQGSYSNQNNQNPGNQGNHNNFQQRPQEQPAPGYNNQNRFQNTNNPGNQGNENNFNGNPNQNREPQFNDPNYSDGHQFNQNNPKDTKEQQENNGNLNNNNNNFYINPTTENIKNTVAPVPKNEEKNKGTEKSSDDFPLFVPLGPNDYVYGGDKINITAPKRDTEKAKQADDEDLSIDIRFKD